MDRSWRHLVENVVNSLCHPHQVAPLHQMHSTLHSEARVLMICNLLLSDIFVYTTHAGINIDMVYVNKFREFT